MCRCDCRIEAVSLLRKIGHPREEENLASARSSLAEARELAGDLGMKEHNLT